MTRRQPAGICAKAWHACNDSGARPGRAPEDQCASTASIKRATMLVILIIGFTAGPAVSL